MSDEAIGSVLARVADVLRHHHVDDFAFTGGIAVGVWSAPRQTKDMDVCGTLPLQEVERLLALRDGLRSGSGRMPDMVRFRVGDWDIDLFVSKSEYDRLCLERAVPATIAGVHVRVVTPEDLLIHKMLKLRTDRRRMLQDLADVRSIIEAQGERLDWTHVTRWLDEKGSAFLRSIADATDEELLRRLLHE